MSNNFLFEKGDDSLITIPVWEKANLTLEEAATYSNIGINKLREIIKDKDHGFVICVGSKRLIRRKKFDELLRKNSFPSLDKKGLLMV